MRYISTTVLIGSLYLCFLIVVYSVSTDVQRNQFKLFFQEVCKGNVDFSILDETPFLAVGLFDIENNERQVKAHEAIKDQTQTVLFDKTFLNHSNSVKGKYKHLYSCQKKQKLKLNDTKLYAWKDSQGQRHFADTFPDTKDYYGLTVRNMSSADFFVLNLDSRYSNLPAFASDKMKRDVNHIYKILTKGLGVSQLNPIQLNLKLFDDNVAFNRYKKQVAPTLGSAGGFYISHLNEASVYTGRNNHRMYAVSRHEATHVIVNGAFGSMPVWLNEGLAEYFEQLRFQRTMLRIIDLNPGHLRRLSRFNRISLSSYFNLTAKQWYSESNKHFNYALGWSIVYFLMSSRHDKQFLRYLLDHLGHHYCKPFSDIDYINKHYPGGFKQFEKNWKQWLAGPKNHHRY